MQIAACCLSHVDECRIGEPRGVYSQSGNGAFYAVVNSRIDYCNAILAGAPRTVTDKLQRVLNAAALVVTGTRSLTAAWVRYCMMNFTGSTSPTGCFSSWQ